ncbi:MAG: transcriptional repressor [Candidatus Goldiibacteriota bacterium HGW-Goldbacteria-1]|jgi:Fur family ferric uptake transcriptional regulator|nr:MAG: transcriptional repressor [Candidatus Goldiibacteriota bacterium HGW-Goldbacteria-1]
MLLRFNIKMEQNMDKDKSFSSFLEKKSLKKTRGRDIIVKAAASIKGHFDAEQLLDAVKKIDVKTSRASVYRTIPLLVKAEIVEESIQKDGRRIYEFSQGNGHHDHMICVKCGAILEFHDNVIEKHQELIAKKYNFKMTGHRLEIKGLCSRCKK